MTYELLDSGNEQKLERFGDYTLIRPSPQAIWKPQLPQLWRSASATFERNKPWTNLPNSWNISFKNLTFKIVPTDFGHVGLFPEHSEHWEWMKSKLKTPSSILNLFAYSGAATLFLAKEGHEVCHLDAAKGMVDWARENASLNNLQKAPVRWIVDDALKFLKREVNRGRTYDALLLDPPTFGRGPQGQVFKIERDLPLLLELCKQVLRPDPAFFLLTCHTPGLTPHVLHHLLKEVYPHASLEAGEMLLPSRGFSLPSGCYTRL